MFVDDQEGFANLNNKKTCPVQYKMSYLKSNITVKFISHCSVQRGGGV